MTKKVFPAVNSVTLSGEVVSAPITRRARGGAKQTTFIIGVTSGLAGPARIAVAAPAALDAGFLEALKVGVEVLIEGQLIAAPVRSGRGLTPLRISATRIHALGADGVSQEIGAVVENVVEETTAPVTELSAEKPKRKTTRAKPAASRKTHRTSAISVRTTAKTPAQTEVLTAEKSSPIARVSSDSPESGPTPAVSQHGRQRRRRKIGPEESISLESQLPVSRSGLSTGAGASPVSVSKHVSKPVAKRPAKSRAKKTGVRPKKTTSQRISRPAAKENVSSERAKSSGQRPKKTPAQPPAQSVRTSAKGRPRLKRAGKPSSHSKPGETSKSESTSDSPFALTQSESSFDPFLVDDKE